MAARVVLDEFTVPAEKAALLERSRGRIEALFGVGLAVLGALGAEEPLPARIWLQLRGAQEAVHSAKVSPAWLARATGFSGLVMGASVSLPVKGAARASRYWSLAKCAESRAIRPRSTSAARARGLSSSPFDVRKARCLWLVFTLQAATTGLLNPLGILGLNL